MEIVILVFIGAVLVAFSLIYSIYCTFETNNVVRHIWEEIEALNDKLEDEEDEEEDIK